MLKDILNQTVLNDVLKVQKDLVKSMRKYRLGYTPEDMAISYLRSSAVGFVTTLSPKYDTGSSMTLANTFMVYHSDSLCKPNTYDYGLTEKQCGDLINLITCCAFVNNKFVSDLIKGVDSNLLLKCYKQSLNSLKISDVDLATYSMYSLVDCNFNDLLDSTCTMSRLKTAAMSIPNVISESNSMEGLCESKPVKTKHRGYINRKSFTNQIVNRWLKSMLSNADDDIEEYYINHLIKKAHTKDNEPNLSIEKKHNIHKNIRKQMNG